jgi:hypothetical protein
MRLPFLHDYPCQKWKKVIPVHAHHESVCGLRGWGGVRADLVFHNASGKIVVGTERANKRYSCGRYQREVISKIGVSSRMAKTYGMQGQVFPCSIYQEAH